MPRFSRPNRFCGLFLLLTSTILFYSGCEQTAPSNTTPPKSNSRPSVEAIVFVRIAQGENATGENSDGPSADKVQEFEVDWIEGATAFSVLESAGVPVKSTGSGETRFVSSINNLENQGGGGANWIFSVNGKTGSRSCDATQVNAGDSVQWTYGDYVMEE